MNILNRIFGKNKKKQVPKGPSGPSISSVLTEGQRQKALEFYGGYRDRIDTLVEDTEPAYAPTLLEDKNRPALWKAEHWKWFLSNA